MNVLDGLPVIMEYVNTNHSLEHSWKLRIRIQFFFQMHMVVAFSVLLIGPGKNLKRSKILVLDILQFVDKKFYGHFVIQLNLTTLNF